MSNLNLEEVEEQAKIVMQWDDLPHTVGPTHSFLPLLPRSTTITILYVVGSVVISARVKCGRRWREVNEGPARARNARALSRQRRVQGSDIHGLFLLGSRAMPGVTQVWLPQTRRNEEQGIVDQIELGNHNP
jgi:hypothetical protein